MIWWKKITWRTALLAWLITTATIATFTLAIIPEQKRIFQANLQSKAYGIAVSLRNITATAVVSEDYSSVVDQCMDMLKGDDSIKYIILTRNDGFSLIHERSGWRTLTLSNDWFHPEGKTLGSMQVMPLLKQPTYNFAEPFSYSGVNLGWIHVGLSLDAYDRSVRSVYLRTGLLAFVFTLLSLGGMILYARYLVAPILNLQGVVGRIAAGDLSARASTRRTDELGQLAASVNTMTEALLLRDRTLKETNETLEQRVAARTSELETQIAAREHAHRELEDAQRRMMQLAREAGMAEVATGVLHNVGNVLTSINISANLLRDEITTRPRINLLKQTADLMRDQGANLSLYLTQDARGKLVPLLIIELVEQIINECDSSVKELSHLLENLDHIKQIVAAQQNHAKSGGLIQSIAPTELFEEAIRINRVSAQRHGITLTREFADLPKIETDHHQILHILVNFIGNAIQAVKPRHAGDRRVGLRLDKSGPNILFVVKDNGVGIPPENIQKIFGHGFTTRKDGHGFGLHSGALAARALGGKLHVYSDGLDQGSRFTLELPVTGLSTTSGNA